MTLATCARARSSVATLCAAALLVCLANPAAAQGSSAEGVDPVWVPPPPGSTLQPLPATPPPERAPIQYCAYFSDGTSDCGYPALADCEQTVRGVGGWCDVRPQP